MKNLLTIIFFLLFIASCKKDEISQAISSSQSNSSVQQDEYLTNIKEYLHDNLTKEDYQNIDFDRIVATRFKGGEIYLVRVQFKKPSKEFVLMRTDNSGNCSKGMILNISYSDYQNQGALSSKPHSFNGSIIVHSLDRQQLRTLKINNGYKERRKNDDVNSIVPEYEYDNVLPDVVVTAYISEPNGGTTYGDWYNLFDLYSPSDFGLDNNGGGSNNNGGTIYGYYSPVDLDDLLYHGIDHSRSFRIEYPRRVEYENVELLPAISIDDYLKCFDNIPDSGATCSIEIFADLPVNGEPKTFFDWTNGTPGHSFIQIKKINGTQTVQQTMGFYPDQGWKTMFYTPVNGKFVDDGGHEFNASLKMNITPQQLDSLISKIDNLSGVINYDIDEYNCTNFALQIFNSVRPGNELTIPLFILPGNTGSIQTETPQGLYQKLLSMKEAGVSEAVNITVPPVCGFVGASNGSCK